MNVCFLRPRGVYSIQVNFPAWRSGGRRPLIAGWRTLERLATELIPKPPGGHRTSDLRALRVRRHIHRAADAMNVYVCAYGDTSHTLNSHNVDTHTHTHAHKHRISAVQVTAVANRLCAHSASLTETVHNQLFLFVPTLKSLTHLGKATLPNPTIPRVSE